MTGPSPVRQLVRKAMAVALPRRMYMTSGPPDAGALAVTFDDGPDPVHSPAVLDRLAALGMRATFFVIGSKAEAHPELVRRIAGAGHEVGHHSYSHGPPATTSALGLIAEARRTSALLEKLLGRAPRLYRPPFGKLTLGKTVGLWACRQTIVLWNQDPKDFSRGSADAIASWIERAALQPGDILLLHDTHAHAAPALDALAERARRLGLRFATPGDWLA